MRVEPWGKTGVDEAEAMFREQAQALLDGKVDLFILETFRDLNEIGAAIAAVRSVCDLPIVAQMTTEEDGASLDGAPPEQFAPELIKRGANVVGVNCSVGPAPMLETVERISDIVDVWLSAQPNAGKPRDIEGRNLYLCSPEYMASYARRFIASGVRLVGGCCGTTPEHIRQIALAAKSMAPGLARHARSGRSEERRSRASRTRSRRWRANRSRRWRRKLVNGGFIRAIELVPPRGHAPSSALDDAARLAEARRRRGDDSRRPALRRADERAVDGGARAAACGSGGAAAVFVSRSEPAGHPVGSARRARDGRAQRAGHHRRCAQVLATSRMRPRCSTSIRSG